MKESTLQALGRVLVASLAISAIGIAGTAVADEGVDIRELDGSGTEEDPYVITTVEELQSINQDLEGHYILGNDINARDTNSWNSGTGFKPVGDGDFGDRSQTPFSGSFNGQGHTISGLVIDRPGEHFIAPFGVVTGTVENVHLEDVEVYGTERRIAGLAGDNLGTIQDVSVTGTVEGEDLWVGGLVARGDEGAIIKRSMADVNVKGEENVGGLVGDNNEQTIVESYTTGNVEGTDSVGSLVGWKKNGDDIIQSYATGDVSGEERTGGVIGALAGPISDGYVVNTIDGNPSKTGVVYGLESDGHQRLDAVVSDFYYEKPTNYDGTGEGDDVGTGLSKEEMTGADAKTNMDLDFENFWAATDEYPILQWQVQDVDLSVSQPSIGEGETTSVTVELTLNDGSTVTASEVADYDSETAVASVSDGTLAANSVGQTELTATVAGESDTVTVEVLEPPNIEFSDAEFDTEAAVEGTTVDATVTYENTGGPGSETATVTVDGETVATETVHVDADSETTESIQWTAQRNGTVAVDGEPVGDLSIVAPEAITLESISLPDEAAQDSEYDIELEFNNTASHPVVDTVELRVNGAVGTTKTVEIGAGESTETITYAHDKQGTATHVVDHHSDDATGTVAIIAPAEFTLDELDAPETVTNGENGSVSVTVTNTGGAPDTQELDLLVDGELVDTQSVTLDSGGSETLEFTPAFDQQGEVTVTIASADDELETVVESTAAASDDGSSGFGGAVALAAIVLAVVVMRRH